MQVTAISDLHGHLPKNLPGGDLLLIAGDIVPLQVQTSIGESLAWLIEKFFKWAAGLPYARIIFIAGNHDFFFDKHWGPGADDLKTNPKWPSNLIYLENEDYEFIKDDKVWRVWGSPNIQNLERWAFYQPKDVLYKTFSKIPYDTDILVTHQPPAIKNYGKIQDPSSFHNGTDCGSKELAEVIQDRDIKLHVFGHIHSGEHKPEDINGTIYANVSIKDETYKAIYKPLNIEL